MDYGCDISVKKKIMSGESWISSTNDYDWLGHGIYFFENDERRALDWAVSEAKRSHRIKNHDVIGAKIDLGRCLDATTLEGIDIVVG